MKFQESKPNIAKHVIFTHDLFTFSCHVHLSRVHFTEGPTSIPSGASPSTTQQPHPRQRQRGQCCSASNRAWRCDAKVFLFESQVSAGIQYRSQPLESSLQAPLQPQGMNLTWKTSLNYSKLQSINKVHHPTQQAYSVPRLVDFLRSSNIPSAVCHCMSCHWLTGN